MSDPKVFDTYPKAESGLATCSGDPAQDEKVSSKIKRRVHEKMDDYESYRFSAAQSTALNIFFDLVQEFEGEHEFYSVIVTVPKVLFNLDSNLYLLTEEKKLELVCYTKEDIPHGDLFDDDGLAEGPELRDKYYVLPIRANKALIEQLPFSPPDGIIGCYVVYPAQEMSDRELLFWEKYANRIGFQLHNRIINAKNREHLEFIRSLVRDIGHNVIVPNMYFRLFFNRLRGRIEGIKQLRDDLDVLAANYAINDPAFRNLGAKIDYFHDALKKQYNEIFRHYEQTSLFLETLLRQRHFDEGRYVLEKRRCNLKKRVIEPQLERYRSRLEERDIRIDMSMGGVPDKEICLVADIGLVSQVYANLFSNAVKYAREVELNGKRDKYLAFGWEYIEDYFGSDKPGIKFNVFTTGPHLSEEDAAGLYESGFRGRNISGEYGTGHGLSFVKEIVELHDGEVGYERRPHGNNFFFVLPADPEHIKNCL